MPQHLRNLSIDIDAAPGTDISVCIQEMVMLANRLGISVRCKMNGVNTLAAPGDDPKEIWKSWQSALEKGYTHASQRTL